MIDFDDRDERGRLDYQSLALGLASVLFSGRGYGSYCLGVKRVRGGGYRGEIRTGYRGPNEKGTLRVLAKHPTKRGCAKALYARVVERLLKHQLGRGSEVVVRPPPHKP